MATSRVSHLRHLSCLSRAARLRGACAQQQQRRWAQVHDVRFVATHAPPPVLEKYRDKLDRKAREEGHADIESLKKAYANKITAVRKEAAAVGPSIPAGGEEAEEAAQQHPQSSSLHPSTTQAQNPTPPPPPSPTNKPTRAASSVKPLSEILDLPKARALPVPELTAVWRLRHASDARSLCAVIPAHTFAAMEAAAKTVGAQFVVPVPHAERGAEMHFLQWTWDAGSRTATVLFTQLAEYKARGEWAAPHTSVTHHADLAAEKGVVLMQGSVAPDRGVTVEDARWLVMCLQRFYGGWDGAGGEGGRERADERRRLLEWFARGDPRFTVERLMAEAERMG